ncbi:MAG: ion channel [Desulfurivibrionaceae bacterium]
MSATGYYLISAILVAGMIWDSFITVFSARGAGFFTRLWTRHFWKVLLTIHRLRPIHRLLTLVGPFMLLTTIIFWWVILGVSLFAALAAVSDSVINSKSGTGADFAEIVYFVGSTITSLGYGDLVASGAPWTYISCVAAFAATVVITISLSYVLSVLAASIDRKTLAQNIYALGKNPSEIIEKLRKDEEKGLFREYLLNLSTEINRIAHKHLAYPVLHFFHSLENERSAARAILLLSDSLFLLSRIPGERERSGGLLGVLMGSVVNYGALADFKLVNPPAREGEADRILDDAHNLNLDAEHSDFRKALDNYLPLRRELVAICLSDGWCDE